MCVCEIVVRGCRRQGNRKMPFSIHPPILLLLSPAPIHTTTTPHHTTYSVCSARSFSISRKLCANNAMRLGPLFRWCRVLAPFPLQASSSSSCSAAAAPLAAAAAAEAEAAAEEAKAGMACSFLLLLTGVGPLEEEKEEKSPPNLLFVFEEGEESLSSASFSVRALLLEGDEKP